MANVQSAPASTPSTGATDDVRGVPMVQLAAIHAAVAEGFDLAEVLDVESLPRDAWFEAELSWKAKLVTETATMDAYAQELTRQQDRLGRRVEPLEENLEDWITFLKSYATHPDPFDLLNALSLGFNDMARLGRLWALKFDTLPALAKKAAKLSLKLDRRVEKGEKLLLPPVAVGAPRLSPSPAAGSFAQAAADAPRSLPSSAPVLGLDQYASLSADLRVADANHHEAVLARYGVEARHAMAMDEAWRCRLESDDELRQDFRVLVGHYEQKARMRQESAAALPMHHSVPVAPKVPQAPRAPTPVEAFLAPLPLSAPAESFRVPPLGTAPGLVMAHVKVLPFAGRVTSMPPAMREVPARPPRRDGDIDATTDVIPALLDSEIMPFEDTQEEDFGYAEPTHQDVDGTMMVGAITFDDDDVMPFSGGLTAPPPSPQPGALAVGLPFVGTIDDPLNATSSFIITLDDDDLLSTDGSLDMTAGFVIPFDDEAVLPFSEPVSSKPPPSAIDHTLTSATPSDLDTTVGLETIDFSDDDLSGEDALPFSAPHSSPDRAPKLFDVVSDPSQAEDIDSTTLFHAIDLGLDDDDDPEEQIETHELPASLSLDQLASLHAEQAVRPNDAVAIRNRYQLRSAEEQAHAESFWQTRFARDPAVLAAYHDKFAAFRAWLLRQ